MIPQTLLRANTLPTLGASDINLPSLSSIHSHLLNELGATLGRRGSGLPGHHLSSDGVVVIIGNYWFAGVHGSPASPILHCVHIPSRNQFSPIVLEEGGIEPPSNLGTSAFYMLRRFLIPTKFTSSRFYKSVYLTKVILYVCLLRS